MSRNLVKAGGLLSAVLAGCSPSTTLSEPCNDALPAFSLSITAVDGTVPAGTRVTVTYGGGTESFTVGETGVQHQLIFCVTDPVDAGTGGLTCDLWTQASTTLSVEASGYAKVTNTYPVVIESGCRKTGSHRIVLGSPDAGN